MKITITAQNVGRTDGIALKIINRLCGDVNGTLKANTGDQVEIATKARAPKVLPVLAREIARLLEEGNGITVSIETGGKHTTIVKITDEQAVALKVASDARNEADDAFYSASDVVRGFESQVIIGGCPVPRITEVLQKTGGAQVAAEFNGHVEAIHSLIAKYNAQAVAELAEAKAERDRLRSAYYSLRGGIYQEIAVEQMEL